MEAPQVSKFLIFLAENSPDVFWIRDPDYAEQIYISPVFEKIWQRDPQELYDYPDKWSTYIHPDDLTKIQESVSKRDRKAEPGDEFLEEYRIIRPSGEIRDIRDHSFPIFDDNGVHIGFAGIARDVTQELLDAKNIKQAKEAAETASKAKSEFIANMSHDIRTPITGMLGLIKSVHDNVKSDALRYDAQLLEGCTNEVLNLLNEVLEFTSLEAGKLEQEHVAFDLKDIINRRFILLKPPLRNRPVELNLCYPADIPQHFMGNKIFIDRIVLNLLSNSVKFTNEGHITVTINCLSQKTGLAKLEFTVEDSGIGIPNDKFEDIFEHFSRLTPSYEGIYKGSGLGLYVVKRYVEAMDGSIDIKSEVDKGSTFTVTLTLEIGAPGTVDTAEVEPAESLKIPPPLPKVNKKAFNGKPLAKVLIVEDSALAARMAVAHLNDLQCVTDVALDGTIALEKLNNATYDIVLMDVGLPGMSGMEVTKKIRQIEDSKVATIPIIALTGHATDVYKLECLKSGMDDVLIKPINALAIENLLERYVYQINDTKEKPTDFDALPPIDLAVGAAIIGVDQSEALEILQLLHDSLQNEDKPNIDATYKSRDYDALSAALHRLNGALCYRGTPRLGEVTKRFHQAVHIQGAPEIDASYLEFDQEVQAFYQAYHGLQKDNKQGSE